VPLTLAFIASSSSLKSHAEEVEIKTTFFKFNFF
jgi:hypothetical protein